MRGKYSPTDDLPEHSNTTRIARRGVDALLRLLHEANIPCFEVPLEDDKGVDVLAYVVTHTHSVPPGFEGESAWLRDWAAAARGEFSGEQPTTRSSGTMVGFQVRTKGKFDDEPDWTLSIKRMHVNFWNSSNIPVYIVASNSKGQLRFLPTADIPEPKATAKSVSATLKKPFGERELTLLLRRLRADHVAGIARQEALSLFSADPAEQLDGIVACLASGFDPGTARALGRALPHLDDMHLPLAVQIVGAMIRQVDDLAADHAHTAEEHEGVSAVRSALGLWDLHFTDSEWLRIVEAEWRYPEVVEIRQRWFPVENTRAEHGGAMMLATPDDPWPERHDNVSAQAKHVYNGLSAGSLEPLVDLLLTQDAPDDVIERLMIADLRGAHPRHDPEWWMALLSKTATEVAYRDGHDRRRYVEGRMSKIAAVLDLPALA